VEKTTPEVMLQWLWQDFDYRIDVGQETKGAQAEAFCWMRIDTCYDCTR
jgi:hypothetical protein